MKKYAEVAIKHCVACGTCQKVCPKGAINVYKGLYAKVTQSHCIGCGLCAKVCPADIIVMKEEMPHD